jgi:flagellar biosynthesis protein FlhG
MEFFIKNRMAKDITKLVADFIILDLGAGTSYNVVDFFLLSYRGIVVVRPEITSILNAYSLLKCAVFRLLYRAFPGKGPERERIRSFVSDRIEGSGRTFVELAREMARDFPKSAGSALEKISRFVPKILANETTDIEDKALLKRLQEVVVRNLGIGIEFEAFFPEDPYVAVSVAERKPLVISRPDTAFSRATCYLADKLLTNEFTDVPGLFDDDLELAAARFFESERADVHEAGIVELVSPDGENGPSL